MSQTIRAIIVVATLTFMSSLPACGGSAAIYQDREAQQTYRKYLQGDGAPAKPSGDHALAGEASWYGPGLQGNSTANGERYDMYGQTAAHRTLPFGTILKVVRRDTRQYVVVRVNDRGPYAKSRVIDLSYGAAFDLGIVDRGVADVEIEVIRLGK